MPSSANLSLTTVVVIASDNGPRVLLHPMDQTSSPDRRLPESSFSTSGHRTFEEGVRDSIRHISGLGLGYVEQLYTFGDMARTDASHSEHRRDITFGYVALTRLVADGADEHMDWADWYDFFPWEDWRLGRPDVIDGYILPKLDAWIQDSDTEQQRLVRQQRTLLCFGKREGDADSQWNTESALERFELLYSANLIPESTRDRGFSSTTAPPAMGRAMDRDHRRILATAISRIRGKIKYRPVVFELVPERFTLFHLQKVVESLSGIPLHKQNFRRLVEAQGLVERTKDFETTKRGRPAELFKFRAEVVLERPAPGVRSGYQSFQMG